MVLEPAAGTVIAVEIKAAETVRAEDFRGLRQLATASATVSRSARPGPPPPLPEPQ